MLPPDKPLFNIIIAGIIIAKAGINLIAIRIRSEEPRDNIWKKVPQKENKELTKIQTNISPIIPVF